MSDTSRLTDDPGFEVVSQAQPDSTQDRLTDDPGFEVVDHAEDFEADPGFEIVSRETITKADFNIVAACQLGEQRHGSQVIKAGFDESKHPRGKNGEFSDGGGGKDPGPMSDPELKTAKMKSEVDRSRSQAAMAAAKKAIDAGDAKKGRLMLAEADKWHKSSMAHLGLTSEKMKSNSIKPIKKDDASVMAHIESVEELQPPIEPIAEDLTQEPHDALGLIHANKLIAGMDQEIMALNISPEEARRKASRALHERPELYNSVGTTPETTRLHGIQLDIGCGPYRQPGFIGLDTETYGDYGIALHDVSEGLSDFPDGCARAVRLVDTTVQTDMMPLLNEIQRVLCVGGQLIYEDVFPLYARGGRWPFVGLALSFDGQTPYDQHKGTRRLRQVFTRVEPRVPAYHGAEPDFAPAGGSMPIDLAMALNAYNSAPAHLAMANLIHKAEHKTVKIAKAEPMKQVVIGVVLAPDEIDSQGDVISAEDIESAAHGYMGTSRIIGSEHGAPIEAHPVESYIAPQDLSFGDTIVKKGSWVLGVKVNDPEQWKQVMNDGYTGFSVGGFGLRDDM